MDAEFFEPPFRIYVQSSSRENMKFLVDLEEYDFHGSCSCEDFSLRRVRDVQLGKESECKHLPIAKRFWYNFMVRKVSEKMKGQNVSR